MSEQDRNGPVLFLEHKKNKFEKNFPEVHYFYDTISKIRREHVERIKSN